MPGPEEKRIVSTYVPIAAERNYLVNENPMVLRLLENNLVRKVNPNNWQREPIIEEPATPEQDQTDPEESDIEDLLREDPDEIPFIELNAKESTMNVQNHFEEYREHFIGDMSKALVALAPQSASIPTPKLKNVSRLRTEHQV